MNTYIISEIKDDSYFTSDILIDPQFLVTPKQTPLTSNLKKALLDWNFKQLICDGCYVNTPKKTVVSTFENVDMDDKSKTISSIKKRIQDTIDNSISDTKDSDVNRLEIVQKVYNEYMNYISSIYTHYATHKELNEEEIAATVKEMCVFIKENKRYMLRVQPTMEARNRDFLVTHSMRSTVLAIAIGLQLRLPLNKLVNLGVACILHEIGQIRLPPQLYLSNRPLTNPEKKIMNTHPVLSYEILKSQDFPLSISLAALEHHERENGEGYPRHLPGSKISMFAKIISVACSFEAITAPRHYKSAQSSYIAMVDMLKNSGNQYDETVIKALLYSLSLYPIGSYVFLSNGKIGLIIDVNPLDPRNPIVRIYNETEPNGDPKIISTSDKGIKISRVLNAQEKKDIIKS
ncbi:MAG: metal-dependent phosphohydrolase [Treponema sp. CETP13]|nr:MAG: metal-dependent phosphohydrolase [Treponema sp. CETP13]